SDAVAGELVAYATVVGGLGQTGSLEDILNLARGLPSTEAITQVFAGTALAMIGAGAADRAAAVADELLAADEDEQPDVCTAAAAQVAAAVPADDLTVRVVARAESLESPLALAAVADLMARREDDASAARLA